MNAFNKLEKNDIVFYRNGEKAAIVTVREIIPYRKLYDDYYCIIPENTYSLTTEEFDSEKLEKTLIKEKDFKKSNNKSVHHKEEDEHYIVTSSLQEFINFLSLYPYYVNDFEEITERLKSYNNNQLLEQVTEAILNKRNPIPIQKEEKTEEVLYTKAIVSVCGDYPAWHEMIFKLNSEIHYEHEIEDYDRPDGDYCNEDIIDVICINGDYYVKI